jgi:hypothetical protein
MASTTTAPADVELRWQSEGQFQIATDGTRLHMQKGAGVIVFDFLMVLAGGLMCGVGGVYLVCTETAVSSRLFAGLLLLISTFFFWLFAQNTKRGRWNVVYERGGPGVPAEIRYWGRRLAADRVRCFTTRYSGGRVPTFAVIAELHDGTHQLAGPDAVGAWADHFGQQAANWLGLPFRSSRK